MISSGIYEGSYVVLKEYRLARAKKLLGGNAMYLMKSPESGDYPGLILSTDISL